MTSIERFLKYKELMESDPNFAKWFKDRGYDETKVDIAPAFNDDEDYLSGVLNDWNQTGTTAVKSKSQGDATTASTIQDQANATAADSAEQEASANATANINAGMNAGTAGLLGSANANANVADTANAMYQGNRATQASTQADYMEKMADAKSLDQQVKNMENASHLNTISAVMQGAGAGASLGSMSDENMKESPEGSSNNREVDINELLEKVAQFFELKKRLDELKGAKE